MKSKNSQSPNSLIKPTQAFSHPLSDKVFASAAAARKDYKICLQEKKEREAEEYRKKNQDTINNRLRLEADSIESIKELMVSMLAEYGVKLTIHSWNPNFGYVSTSHGAPIGKPTTWGKSGSALGWSGHINGLIEAPKNKNWSFSDFVGCWSGHNAPISFKGLHTGTGGGGYESFQYHFYFFLEDFPKLKAKYEEYQKSVEERAEYQKLVDKAVDEAIERTKKFDDIIELNGQLENVNNKLQELEQMRVKLLNHAGEVNKAITLIQNKEIENSRLKRVTNFKPEQERQLDKLFSNFS